MRYTRKANAKRAIEKIGAGLFDLAWQKGLIKFEADHGFDEPVVCNIAAIKKLWRDSK